MPPLNIPAPEPWRSLAAEWERSLRVGDKCPETVRCHVDVVRKFRTWGLAFVASPHVDDPAARKRVA